MVGSNSLAVGHTTRLCCHDDMWRAGSTCIGRKTALERLLDDQSGALQTDPSIAGFNIGINAGEAAGQTVFHCHVHLIPRRPGDVENPRGGVRHVIPGRGAY